MTPAETAAILRQLHDWLRGGTQWAPTMGAEAVKTAIEMIDRLEAAEKERDTLRSVLAEFQYGAAVANETIKALQAKIEAMEKRLRLILEEPENTMSNSKAMREMLRQARLALEETK